MNIPKERSPRESARDPFLQPVHATANFRIECNMINITSSPSHLVASIESTPAI